MASNNVIKKILYITSTLLIVSSSISSGEASAKVELQKIYHVYVGNQYIGIVHDIDEAQSAIKQKIQESKSNYPNLEMDTSKEVEFVPENTFQPKEHDQQTIEWINNNIEINAVGQEIRFGDQAVFVASKSEAEEVIKNLKLKFTSDSTVTTYISPEPIVEEVKVSPENVLKVTDAVNYILKGTSKNDYHIVKEGEVLGGIINSYDISKEEFFELNSINENSILQIGQKLIVKSYKPIADVIEEKLVIENVPIPFETEVVEDESLYKGDQKVKQAGSNGEKVVQYKYISKNGQLENKEVVKEDIIKQPVKQIVVKGTKVIPSRGTGTFTWPTVGGYVSSKTGARWGTLHKGTDIARPSDLSILSADNGTVTFAGWNGGYGNKIEISHNNGYKTIYAHLNSISVNVGQTVEKGSKIGIMGTTGDSTGVHLHIELYKNGQLKNFLDYVN